VGTLSIYDIICLIQAHDDEAALVLIKRFNPLLMKYARKLGNEDAYNDLMADFLGMLHEFKPESMEIKADGAFVNYFQNAVYHFYTKHLRKKIDSFTVKSFSEVSEEELRILETKASAEDRYFQDDIFESSNALTEYEANILRMFYCEGWPIVEIANTMNISRQAVNQAKIRANRKLELTIAEI